MAYDDFYIDKVTMRGNCDVDSTGVGINEHANDTLGQPPGCKFLGPGEPATTERANRTRLQLAENCDILKGPLDALIAVGRVAALNSFGPASSITINPLATGGSDVEFSTAGYLYVGNATDYSDNQESRDTLFQLVDEDYNEVLVGGTEVYVSAVAPVGAVPGNGFYNAGVVTLTLSDTIPAGNYRLIYARDMTLATMPDDALIRSEIRGVHEAAGEAGLKGVRVLDPSAAPALPADFIGPTALQDALTALGDHCTLYLRSGTYATGALNISQSNVRLIGESKYGVILQPGGGNDLTISGDFVRMERMQIDLAAGQKFRVIDSTPSIVNYLELYDLELNNDIVLGGSGAQLVWNLTMQRVRVVGAEGNGLYMYNVAYGTISNCYIDSAGTAAGLEMTACFRLAFTQCQFEGGTAKVAYLHNTLGTISQISFLDCAFQGATGATASAVDVADVNMLLFDNCSMFTALSTGVGDVIPCVNLTISEGIFVTFRNCGLSATNRAVFHSGTVAGQLTMDNCHFSQGVSGSPTISGDALFKFISATLTGNITVSNCIFRAQRWAGSASGCLQMVNVQGNNIRFHTTGMTGGICSTDTMVLLQNCVIDVVVVDFDDVVPDTTGGADAAVRVLYDSKITHMKIANLAGSWAIPSLPILEILGAGGAGPGRVQAEVDGLEVECATSWDPASVGAIRIENYGTLRRLQWFDMPITGSTTCIVALGLSTGPTRARLLDSEIQWVGSATRYVWHLIAVYNDGDGFEICGNRFDIYPSESDPGPPAEIWPRKVVLAGLSATALTWPNPDPTDGQKYGKIENNIFIWRSNEDYDLDPPLSPNGALLFLTDDAWFCSITNNVFEIHGNIPNGNYAIWIENAAATFGGATLDNEPNAINGHTVLGNKFWAVDQVVVGQAIGVYTSFGVVVGINTSTHDTTGIAVCNTV